MSGISLPKFNVNVGLYIISLTAIGFGQYHHLWVLFGFGIISGLAALISILWVLPAYTKRYVEQKENQKKKAADNLKKDESVEKKSN